jgi:hypothetical protein
VVVQCRWNGVVLLQAQEQQVEMDGQSYCLGGLDIRVEWRSLEKEVVMDKEE